MIRKARAKPRAKARREKKPESVTSATNLDICVRTALCTRNAWPRKMEAKRRSDTTAAVQGATAAAQRAMIETWEYTEDDYVFAFGEAVISAVQRPETHICIDSGAPRSAACPIGYAPDVSAKGTALPSFSIDGSAIEQRGCKKVHWEKRDSAGETKRVGSTMVESSVLFLVASVSSLEENGTSVVFSCSGDNATTIAISRSFKM